MVRKYVVTGGPGCGKTTLIDEMKKKGYYTIPEVARQIIDEQLKNGGNLLPWTNRDGFQRKVAEVQRDLESKIPIKKTAILDRGMLDGLAYYLNDNIKPPEGLYDPSNTNYEVIFIPDELPNYVNDEARMEDLETARKLHKLLRDVYEKAGYVVKNVPVMSPEERANYIEEYIRGDQI